MYVLLHVIALYHLAPDIRQDFVTLNISRNVGDEVTFTCLLSDGVPKPTITWTKDNIVLRTTLRMKIDDVGVLKIFDVSCTYYNDRILQFTS